MVDEKTAQKDEYEKMKENYYGRSEKAIQTRIFK